MGVGLIHEADANAASAFKPGASIRVDGTQDGVTGIRFTGYVNETDYNKVIENGAYKAGCEIGMSVVPQAIFDKFDESGAADFFTWLSTSENVSPEAVSATFPVDKIMEVSGQDGTYEIKGVIDVLEVNYAYDYQAISYYKVDGQATYLGRSEARSISDVAHLALEDAESGLNGTQKQVCADVIKTTTDIKLGGTNGTATVSVESLDDCIQDLKSTYFSHIEATDLAFSLAENSEDSVVLNGSTMSALSKGTEAVTVSAYDGLFTYTLNVNVGINVTLESTVNAVELFMPTTLSGATYNGV